MPSTPNPYEVLRIAVLASEDEIVTRGIGLIQAESSEDRKKQFRSAVEALTTHPKDRAYHQFWEPAGAGYRDAAEEAFLTRYGAGPVDREALTERVRVFLEQDCAAERLLDSLMPGPAPPAHIEDVHPAGTPQTPLQLELEPRDLFL
jgi:curved DNA-binding protein CbpA